jgi:lactoylglutathione lyase
MRLTGRPGVSILGYINMKVEHIAIWVRDLEQSKEFYKSYFGAVPGEKYSSASRKFESYFLNFESGPRLEIMWSPKIVEVDDNDKKIFGFIHLAISVGSEDGVISLTNQLRKDGFKIKSEPRHTGDGYFESIILDPDGNPIEITV